MRGMKSPLESLNKVCIIFFTDGRDEYTEKMLKSFHENVIFPFESHKILMVDNPGQDIEYIHNIQAEYNIDQVFFSRERLGIFGSVQKAWSMIPEDCNYVWHQENDFLFNEKVDIPSFVRALDNKLVHQVALLRQAWYDNEVAAGGIFQANPKAYRRANIGGVPLVVHREYFTHNPCLYRKNVVKHFDNYNEYSMMRHLPSGGWSAFYGTLTDAPRITHIGVQKV